MSFPQSNREILSVADLNKAARRLLEGEFPMIFVEGEISNFTRPSSGHWYFTLKDDSAQIRCAMFKNRNSLIRFKPANGTQVVLRGKLSLYEGRGDYQLIGEFMEEAGDGALRQAFEKLKARLAAEGLFETSAKQPLPAMPRHIGIITSPTGAAIRDILHVLERRFPAIRISILPVQVQGEDSPRQIAEAIGRANAMTEDPFDLLLVARGGGSLEDLWAFNTEPVARAIFASQLPVVSAVGHETDVSISDFVADLRAPTPSAAAELISPDQTEWLTQFRRHEQQLISSVTNRLQSESRQLEHLSRRLRHPGRRLQDLQQRLDDLEIRLRGSFRHHLAGYRIQDVADRLKRAMQQTLQQQQNRLRLLGSRQRHPLPLIQSHQQQIRHLRDRLVTINQRSLSDRQAMLREHSARLNNVSPLNTLARGYAIVTAEVDGKAQLIRSAAGLKPGDIISARLNEGELTASVTDIALTDKPEELT
ncbi:MAG: exodeoxyribonuclease VII large subunit [Pseudomonadales bacterium]|nr:exodeoxyribonuclease VII large subunit [Pseudomonadales bacterium]